MNHTSAETSTRGRVKGRVVHVEAGRETDSSVIAVVASDAHRLFVEGVDVNLELGQLVPKRGLNH